MKPVLQDIGLSPGLLHPAPPASAPPLNEEPGLMGEPCHDTGGSGRAREHVLWDGNGPGAGTLGSVLPSTPPGVAELRPAGPGGLNAHTEPSPIPACWACPGHTLPSARTLCHPVTALLACISSQHAMGAWSKLPLSALDVIFAEKPPALHSGFPRTSRGTSSAVGSGSGEPSRVLIRAPRNLVYGRP